MFSIGSGNGNEGNSSQVRNRIGTSNWRIAQEQSYTRLMNRRIQRRGQRPDNTRRHHQTFHDELNYRLRIHSRELSETPKYQIKYLIGEFPPTVFFCNDSLLQIYSHVFFSKLQIEKNKLDYLIFLRNQHIRWAFKKLVFLWYGKRKSKLCINDFLLNGDSIEESEEEVIYIMSQKQKRSFATTFSEILEIIINGLTYRDHHSQWIQCKKIKNPYTNEVVPQYVLYDLLKDHHSKNKWIRLFQSVNCNFKHYLLYSNPMRMDYGIRQYVNTEENLPVILDDIAHEVWSYCQANEDDRYKYHPRYFAKLYERRYVIPAKEVIEMFKTYYCKLFLSENDVYPLHFQNYRVSMKYILNSREYMSFLLSIVDYQTYNSYPGFSMYDNTRNNTEYIDTLRRYSNYTAIPPRMIIQEEYEEEYDSE